MLKNNFYLILIILLAAILRFYQLGQNPPSLDWDETAHGYNALSILKTGRDEYGYKFPLSFRSFDDYKPPVYTYLVVPSIAIFGLNDFAVRLPSAILGVLAVLFTYLMVKELFPRPPSQLVNSLEIRNLLFQRKTFQLDIPTLAALMLAISPWHLQFSRVAFETNSAIFLSVSATWAFLKAITSKDRKRTLWLSISAIAFGVNLFMYHNARVFVPIYSIVLIYLFKDNLLKSIKSLILPAAISLIFALVLLPVIFSTAGQMRFKGTTIFADVSPQYKAAELIAQDENQGQLTLGRIFHNRRLVYIPILIENYLSHFRPDFLFLNADMDRHHAPQIGLLYLWDIPFILAGIYFLIAKKFEVKSKVIIFWWFLIAPIASSVTWGVPHSLRSEIYLPTYQIFTAIGAFTIYSSFKHKRLFTIFVALLLFANFSFYLHQYYIHMPYEYSKAWIYGRREAALYSEEIKDRYDRVIVSTKLEQPHEFWLYYLKYDPKKYLEEGGTVSGGFLEDRNKFDRYLFRPIDYEQQRQEAKTLFVGTPQELSGKGKTLKVINYINGEPAIHIVSDEI